MSMQNRFAGYFEEVVWFKSEDFRQWTRIRVVALDYERCVGGSWLNSLRLCRRNFSPTIFELEKLIVLLAFAKQSLYSR